MVRLICSHDVLAGFLDDPVALAEAALSLGGAILDFLFRVRICSGVSLARSLANAWPSSRNAACSFWASSFSFWPRGVQFLVGRLVGGGDPQHVGHRQNSDDGGRGRRSLRNRRNFRRRRQLDLERLLRQPACSPIAVAPAAAASEAAHEPGTRPGRA